MNGTLTSTKRGDTLFHKAHLETVLATLECIRKQEEFGMSKNDIPCQECGEPAVHNLHHDVANPMTSADVHFDECDYSASYKGAIQGWVPSMLCHEYERGCYCGERGRCEVCVDQADGYADYLRQRQYHPN